MLEQKTPEDVISVPEIEGRIEEVLRMLGYEADSLNDMLDKFGANEAGCRLIINEVLKPVCLKLGLVVSPELQVPEHARISGFADYAIMDKYTHEVVAIVEAKGAMHHQDLAVAFAQGVLYLAAFRT